MEPIPISTNKESEAFWKNHIELQKTSGLSRANYCRQNKLTYHCFCYWQSKWSSGESQKPSSLIAIQLKPRAETESQKTLCTLLLSGGRCLKIHDRESLSIILDRLH
jgi:hypothetical protein